MKKENPPNLLFTSLQGKSTFGIHRCCAATASKLQPVGTISKCTKDAENVYAPLVNVSIGARKRTLTGKTVFQNGSIDTSFDPH
jgi:hypothetical protein